MPLSAVHPETVKELLGPAILEVLPEYALSLARHLPLFRDLMADTLIEHAALVNATYASASGLAEPAPKLRLPLHVEDIEVLSANEANMAYRLAMAYGLAPNWHQDTSASSLVLEAGELWQHTARHIRGLLPLWGLESKVALAYGGTVIVGKAIQAWCDTGHALSSRALRDLCHTTAAEARRTSRGLVAKARDALPRAEVRRARPRGLKLRLPGLTTRRQRPICPACGRVNPKGAGFCAYCGVKMEDAASRIQEVGTVEQVAESRVPDTAQGPREAGEGVQDSGSKILDTGDKPVAGEAEQ